MRARRPGVQPVLLPAGRPSAKNSRQQIRIPLPAGDAVAVDLAARLHVAGGADRLRFSYANSQENIRKALERFGEFAAKVRNGG